MSKAKSFAVRSGDLKLRRADKEITDRDEIESIIRKSLVCRLGLTDNARLYIVPLCFGYTDNRLYFHSATEGRKIEILKRNNEVCFEFDGIMRFASSLMTILRSRPEKQRVTGA
jgi:nitroimidazol reductase NimA-like FMN-containing flavoprotein (pyridoxamine 5'-phosphate oxidase superfamily)